MSSLEDAQKLALLLFAVLPIVLLPHWLVLWGDDLFVMVKIYSVCLAQVWKMLLRLTRLGYMKWALTIVQVLLILNIAEAVIKGYAAESYVNASVGLILMLALLFYGCKSMNIDAKTKWRDFQYDLPLTWVIAYTIWNVIFITTTYPEFIYVQVSLLLAPLIVAIYDNKLWNQARGLTLGVGLLLYPTFPHLFDKVYLTGISTPNLFPYIEYLGVPAILVYLVYSYLKKLNGKNDFR